SCKLDASVTSRPPIPTPVKQVTRSLKPRPLADSNRLTVIPLSRAQLHRMANSTHPSPSARQFRLVQRDAQSELRQVFCSDEGALVRVFIRTRSLKPRPVTVSNRYTLEPCTTPASRCNSTHH